MEINESPVDRLARSATGVFLLVIVLASLAGPVAIVEGITMLLVGSVGVFTLLTGLIGWCPAYALLGIATSEDRPAAR